MAGRPSTRQRRREAAALLVLLVLVVTFGLQDDRGWFRSDDIERQLRSRRTLRTTLEAGWDAEGEERFDASGDYDAAFAAANRDDLVVPPRDHAPLPPYTIDDAINESNAFEATFAVLVYNPRKDNFIGLYNKRHRWDSAVKSKLFASLYLTAYLLRKLFPERFLGPSSPELAVAIGSGDYPRVKLSSLPYTNGKAPVLQFGSAFRDASLFPNMIPMPVAHRNHLYCFEQFATHGLVCKQWRPKTRGDENGELVFGDEVGLAWDELIPQLVWRGTNFNYLSHLGPRSLIKPYAYKPRDGEGDTKEAAVRALRTQYERLLPRWKGIVMSLESELEAEQSEGKRPWADIKFYQSGKTPNEPHNYIDGGRIHNLLRGASEGDLVRFRDISLGGHLGQEDQARYRYHIDLGGGGGTTWTGTVQKLALPGLLFHHVTPTLDYIHRRIMPWRHYIPVSSDLSDLKAKFDWAEANPEKARRIADQATDFMRHLSAPAGFGRMFREDLVEPLRRVIEAYQPVAITHPGVNWVEFLKQSPAGSKMVPVIDCNGRMADWNSCYQMGGDDVRRWAQFGGRYQGSMGGNFTCPSCAD